MTPLRAHASLVGAAESGSAGPFGRERTGASAAIRARVERIAAGLEKIPVPSPEVLRWHAASDASFIAAAAVHGPRLFEDPPKPDEELEEPVESVHRAL